jgi:hypothetical protein
MTIGGILLTWLATSLPFSLIIARMLRRMDAAERREQLRERGLIR